MEADNRENNYYQLLEEISTDTRELIMNLIMKQTDFWEKFEK